MGGGTRAAAAEGPGRAPDDAPPRTWHVGGAGGCREAAGWSRRLQGAREDGGGGSYARRLTSGATTRRSWEAGTPAGEGGRDARWGRRGWRGGEVATTTTTTRALAATSCSAPAARRRRAFGSDERDGSDEHDARPEDAEVDSLLKATRRAPARASGRRLRDLPRAWGGSTRQDSASATRRTATSAPRT